MVGAKRDFPYDFAGRRPAKVRKEDNQLMYIVTLNKLKQGALASLRPGLMQGQHHEIKTAKRNDMVNGAGESRSEDSKADESAESLTRCYVCTSRCFNMTCYHCMRHCCGTCTRQCDGCEGLFCSVCCTANYDERNDRSFCFECKNGGESSVIQAKLDFDYEMPPLVPSTKFRQSTLDFLLRGTQTQEEDQSCSMDIM